MRPTSVEKAVLATLAFFNIYKIPVRKDRIYCLLYQYKVDYSEFENTLLRLVQEKRIYSEGDFFALFSWEAKQLEERKLFAAKQWRKIDKFFWILYLLPFVKQLSVINSLAMGNTNEKSDIDFFVVTRAGLLYTTRSLIIVLLKIFGLYKTRTKVKDRFCFGFYVDENRLGLSQVLIPGGDPLFAFWFGSFMPLYGQDLYEKLVLANPWIYGYLPNFDPQFNLKSIRPVSQVLRVTKKIIEIVLFVPAILIEPLARFIHIRHTNNLPENHWPTSTTIAAKDILKLHALDPRKQFREDFHRELEKYK